MTSSALARNLDGTSNIVQVDASTRLESGQLPPLISDPRDARHRPNGREPDGPPRQRDGGDGTQAVREASWRSSHSVLACVIRPATSVSANIATPCGAPATTMRSVGTPA